MNPLISIIMPVYNSEHYLKDAIESVINQTFNNFELILIDDGSLDSSSEICDHYKEIDNRVEVIHQCNKGICEARNAGLDIAKSEYIMFIDNDDLLDKKAMEVSLSIIKKYDPDLIKFERTEYLMDDGKLLKISKNYFINDVYKEKEILDNLIELRSTQKLTFVWDGIFKRNIIENFHIRFNSIYKTGNEDIEFCLSYAQHCKTLVIYNGSFYNHFTRIGFSTSSKNGVNKYKDNIHLAKISKKIFEENGINILNHIESYTKLLSSTLIYPTCVWVNSEYNIIQLTKKMEMLNNLYNNEVFLEEQKKTNFISIFKSSKRDGLYAYLFFNKQFTILLLVDYLSRMFVKAFRVVKSTIVHKSLLF